MHRTQISLEERQYHNLRRYAERSRQSISAVIRELLDQYIDNDDKNESGDIASPLKQLQGIVSGDGSAVGREHNNLLYEQRESQQDK